MNRTPPALLFLISGFGQYYGLALAVGLFASASATAVAWARIAIAAVVMIPWRRPWRQRWSRREWLASAAFGVVLALMNLTFYTAADHLPMGPAVAIEFTGPIAVAAFTGRGWRMRVGVVLATLGIVLLAGAEVSGGWTRDSLIGLAAILAAALCWAIYILLGRSIATARDGVTSLAVGMAVAMLRPSRM